MVEFTSESMKSPRTLTAIIAVGVFAAASAGVLLYVRYQKDRAPLPGAAPIVIPGMLRPGNPNFEYYRNKVRIENVKASLAITFSQARIAIISGTILNDGDRELEAVELRIALFDVYGKPSKDRTTIPVRPGIPPNRPMQPLEKRSFSVGIEAVEHLWNPKQLVIEITGLKYR